MTLKRHHPVPQALPEALMNALLQLGARILMDQIGEPEALDILEAVALNAPTKKGARS